MASTTALAAAGGVVAVIPLVRSLSPTEAVQEAAGPVTVDIGTLVPGKMLTVRWRGKPVWVLRRTPEMMREVLAAVPDLADPLTRHPYSMPLPAYCANPYRSRAEQPDIVVLVGICTHLGCTPSARFVPGAQPNLPSDWPGGWLCPCHGSTFDLAGRVFKNKPAPQNLDIPRHMYASATQLVIGRDEQGAA
ncbi:ubiquinol-cytochrome c reductase iron-sulfur subunit [Robbsia sp. KACC 23696]|uniref:ubiquinol-cytochrome c reductase iron-sulfur subunit n=1 Tax=Robbsia sp. KACC 23696 TaxID=3149231 RepID=UPI00325C243C